MGADSAAAWQLQRNIYKKKKIKNTLRDITKGDEPKKERVK